MELIKLNQRIEKIKSNKVMGLIESIHGIQLWHLLSFSITIDNMTLYHNSIMSRGSL